MRVMTKFLIFSFVLFTSCRSVDMYNPELIELAKGLYEGGGFCRENESGHPYAGGDGTGESPYIICTALQLDNVRLSLSAHFVLESDINLSGVNLEPIGDTTTPFSGQFDGRHHRILNFQY